MSLIIIKIKKRNKHTKKKLYQNMKLYDDKKGEIII